MSDWNIELPNARNRRRGILPQAERLPARKKHLPRPWLIVRMHCKKSWLLVDAEGYETFWRPGSKQPERRRPKHWFDPPIASVISRHRTEEDARRELLRTRHQAEDRRYNLVHEEVWEQLLPYWR